MNQIEVQRMRNTLSYRITDVIVSMALDGVNNYIEAKERERLEKIRLIKLTEENYRMLKKLLNEPVNELLLKDKITILNENSGINSLIKENMVLQDALSRLSKAPIIIKDKNDDERLLIP